MHQKAPRAGESVCKRISEPIFMKRQKYFYREREREETVNELRHKFLAGAGESGDEG